jgi:parallel beta-helix repeat protein
MKKAICAILILGLAASSSATIINIPADYPTIQQGIDASSDGDTVLVQPGTYVENINFNGHNIVLGSLFLTTGDTSYISTTVIDGDSAGSVVIFDSGENGATVILGFLIENGWANYGGAIKCINSGPLISCNIITGNTAGEELSAGQGGAIYCDSGAYAKIALNMISGNLAWELGGGICCLNESNIEIFNNIISYNNTLCGGAIYCYQSNPIIKNNVFFDNGDVACGGIFIYISSYPYLINNIVRENGGYNRPEVGLDSTSFPIIEYCNIQDTLWPGIGNINLDPLFRDPDNGDFHLMSIACGDSADSPCIDAGDPNILDSLLDCSWGLGGPRSDMGAYGGGDSLITGIFDNMPSIPDRFMLLQNYPNPFNAQTTIRFTIPEPQNVRLTIYDLLGRRVEVLVDDYMQAGVHAITFDASHLSSGVYFYRMESGDRIETKRMVLLK